MTGVWRLDIVGGVGCFECAGGDCCAGVGGLVSRRDGCWEYPLYGGFSASGDDTLGADAPQMALSSSPRRVLPLLPDSAERPETLIERSRERKGSGIGGPERGVSPPLGA